MRTVLGLLLLLSALGPAATPGAEIQQQTRGPLTNFLSRLPFFALETKEPVAAERSVACQVRIALPESTVATQTLSGAVRFHGSSSQAYPKKSFAITLDAPAGWLGMHERAHWVVNAAFIDRSLMRHKLSYDLFRSLSTSNAPRYAAESRFVEVTYNGKYQGAYLLMEKVDGAMLGLRRYDSKTPEHACLYKAVDHAANFDQPGHAGYEQRDPDPLLRAYWTPLDQLNRFVSSARDASFFDPVKGISAQLDLANTMDFHMLVLLTSNLDGFDKNLMLARDAPGSNAPAPRFFFVPWDYDATFGRHWEGSRVGYTRWLSNYLFERLLGDPAYRKQFNARWKQLRQREFAVSTICGMIDSNVQTLGAAADRNAARWRSAAQFYPDTLSFKEDIAQMKDWVVRRTRWLDLEIERRTSR